MNGGDVEDSYSIHLMAVAARKRPALRFAFKNPYHSFLRLAHGDNALAELHFGPRDVHGVAILGKITPLRLMTDLSGIVGLGPIFRRAARVAPFKNGVAYLRGVMTGPRFPDTTLGLVDLGAVSGPESKILDMWNRAGAVGVQINRANIVFETQLRGARNNASCHAGTKTVLKTMGLEFAALGRRLDKPARDLTLEARIAEMRWPDPGSITHDSLVTAQAAMRNALYQSSRSFRQVTNAFGQVPQAG